MKTLLGICVLAACLLSGELRAQDPTEGTRPVYKNIFEMLRNVPGLEVTINSGGIGTVTVRGTGSLTKQTQPLYVVDGVIYSGDIANINVQEVASITVLKDAASATAYGAQGAAGVISITMKKGTMAPNRPTATVVQHTESPYKYFIDHKTKLRVFGQDDKVIIEGIPSEQRGESLVFKKRKNEILVAIKDIKRVEMMPTEE